MFVIPRKRYIESFAAKYPALTFSSFENEYFASLDGYNRLLLCWNFYNHFSQYEYVLIVQTDALVFRDEIHEWCDKGFSYIGSPWFHGLTSPRYPLSFLGVGNGGFSLRKVQDFLRVLSGNNSRDIVSSAKRPVTPMEFMRLKSVGLHCLKFGKQPPFIQVSINEDIFWGLVAPGRHDYFSVPSPKDAVGFAFETAPEYLYELNGYKLPFGCHAWQRYNPQFWREKSRAIGMKLP